MFSVKHNNILLFTLFATSFSHQTIIRPSLHSIYNSLHVVHINPLRPKDRYSGRTAPLTSKRCILYIYSTNRGTEYFKHGIYSPFFFLFKMQFVS